ncbi:MAG: hypothetical protein ACKOA0_13690 [Burkholderiaceae bacterium]
MEYSTQNMDTTWMKWLAGVALGALAMYISDPSVGRQRRALLKDKMTHYRLHTQKLFNSRMRDARNRIAGLQAEASRFLATRKPESSNPQVVDISSHEQANTESSAPNKAAGWVAGAVAVGLLTWWATSRRS